jgi:hypothetical protein
MTDKIIKAPGRHLRNWLFIFFLGILIFVLGYFVAPRFFVFKFVVDKVVKNENEVLHVKTPEAVKAIYMTACIGASKKLRTNLVDLLRETEANSVVIDIKDYSGKISIPLSSDIKDWEKNSCFVSDIKDFLTSLHKQGVYVIGRITVFQDPYYSKLHPELAVKKKSDGSVWKDRKGLSFIDVSAKPYWEHIVAISKEAHDLGFDELNFDYIRFPSDGDMEDIAYPWTGKVEKKEALRHFFGYLYKALRSTGVKTSADLFGMTTTNKDDLNIGQYLEFALPYFDFIAPMVYPSHYPPNWNGYKEPESKPYEVVKYSMDKAVLRASSTPLKLRPWLQDFGLRVRYDEKMVRAQISAVYDSGLTSWMLWSPTNRYTEGALKEEGI